MVNYITKVGYNSQYYLHQSMKECFSTIHGRKLRKLYGPTTFKVFLPPWAVKAGIFHSMVQTWLWSPTCGFTQ
jgi:hypothetical protein